MSSSAAAWAEFHLDERVRILFRSEDSAASLGNGCVVTRVGGVAGVDDGGGREALRVRGEEVVCVYFFF